MFLFGGHIKFSVELPVDLAIVPSKLSAREAGIVMIYDVIEVKMPIFMQKMLLSKYCDVSAIFTYMRIPCALVRVNRGCGISWLAPGSRLRANGVVAFRQ